MELKAKMDTESDDYQNQAQNKLDDSLFECTQSAVDHKIQPESADNQSIELGKPTVFSCMFCAKTFLKHR